MGFSGAAVFAGRAAVRTGSGLVYLGVPEPVWPVAAMKCDEVMPFPLPSEEGKLSPLAEEAIRQRAGGCDAVLVGCGLGRSPGCDGLVRRLLDLPRPLVLDADGINALSGHMDALSRRRDRITVLTPHVCCAHNWFAEGEPIPHLQTEKCFLRRTRRRKKRIAFNLPPAGGKLWVSGGRGAGDPGGA